MLPSIPLRAGARLSLAAAGCWRPSQHLLDVPTCSPSPQHSPKWSVPETPTASSGTSARHTTNTTTAAVIDITRIDRPSDCEHTGSRRWRFWEEEVLVGRAQMSKGGCKTCRLVLLFVRRRRRAGLVRVCMARTGVSQKHSLSAVSACSQISFGRLREGCRVSSLVPESCVRGQTSHWSSVLTPSKPQQVTDIKKFLEIARRKDAVGAYRIYNSCVPRHIC